MSELHAVTHGVNESHVDAGEQDWHLTHALAREADVRMIQRWLAETATLEERFADDQPLLHMLRQTAALLKERRNDHADQARQLRSRRD